MIILMLWRIRNLHGLHRLIIFTRRPGTMKAVICTGDIIVYSVYLNILGQGMLQAVQSIMKFIKINGEI